MYRSLAYDVVVENALRRSNRCIARAGEHVGKPGRVAALIVRNLRDYNVDAGDAGPTNRLVQPIAS
jgi:hypothetical protein